MIWADILGMLLNLFLGVVIGLMVHFQRKHIDLLRVQNEILRNTNNKMFEFVDLVMKQSAENADI